MNNNFAHVNKMNGVNNPFSRNSITGSGNSNTYLSKITSSVQKMSAKTIFIIIAIILFVALAIYYYYQVSTKFKTSYQANSEGKNSEGYTGPTKQAELMLFYAEWCPHCKTAKPIWDDLTTQYQNKTINGYQVLFTEINCTNETAETEQMMNKYNIEGFPTIKLVKDGQVIEYDAKPTRETLNEFLNTVL
jgi:thiol-disulfide isomerase/thioredoxin